MLHMSNKSSTFVAENRKTKAMQVAINPGLYGSAQRYAEQKGLNLTTVIESFLQRFINSEEVAANEAVPDVVLSLLGAGEPVAEEDLNGRKDYYRHLEEKHQ